MRHLPTNDWFEGILDDLLCDRTGVRSIAYRLRRAIVLLACKLPNLVYLINLQSAVNRARTNTDIIRGYALLLETLQGFATAPVLQYDAESIAVFDRLRGQRVRVSTMDLRIAAIAMSRNLVLLTRNVSDFSKVPGLVTEDWTV